MHNITREEYESYVTNFFSFSERATMLLGQRVYLELAQLDEITHVARVTLLDAYEFDVNEAQSMSGTSEYFEVEEDEIDAFLVAQVSASMKRLREINLELC